MVTGTAECVLLVVSWGSGILTGRAKLANVLILWRTKKVKEMVVEL